jgi:hypothetical protein
MSDRRGTALAAPKAVPQGAGIQVFNASTLQEQRGKPHLRNIDIHENRDERSAGIHYVKDRLTVRNKKTFLPIRASSGWH